MKQTFTTERAIRSALLAGAAFGMVAIAPMPSGAQAQTSSAQSGQIEQIIITGTRIRTPNVISNSPVTSVGELEIRANQPVAVEELIKQLPAAVPAIGPATNNGSGGGATIDLRGLGPNRSLVLLDGRRIVPFDLNGAVDTNVIPIALVERVDLVTGGASAVYGADAISGVVNFVLKNDFEGVSASGSYGVSDREDAKRLRTDLVIGGNFANGKGNAVLSVGYTETDPVRQDGRSFGLVTLSSTTGQPVGSATTVPSVFATVTAPGGTALGTRRINPATGQLEPYVAAQHSFNFNPDNYYQTPLERSAITGIARYEIVPAAEVYANLLYVKSDVLTQLAPSGTFLNVFQVPIGNPFIPAAARQQLCAARNIPAANCVVGNPTEIPLTVGRRITELGPRINNFENQMFQTTIGLRGDLSQWLNNWSYDAYFTHGESEQIQTRDNWGSLSKVQQALRALNTTTCTNTANGCVPLNVWGPEGSITPAMVNFINLDALLRQEVEQQVASITFSGDLGSIKSPFADGSIGIAFGYEYRRLEAGNKSDSASQIQSEVLGTGAPLPDRSGLVELSEFYGELLVPLVSDVPGIHSLNAELGYRQSEFSTTGTQNYNTWKAGGDYSPIPDLRLRGMYQKATRAPNINELFAPAVSGLSNLAVDPCAGAATNQAQANQAGTLSNLCRLTGVPVAQLGLLSQPSAGQINVLQGGNPNVGPEEAETVTLGIVVQPSFLEGLTITFDYYDIELTGGITRPSSTDILDDCYSAARNPSRTFNDACALVLRSPITGTFNGADAPGVQLLLSNLGVIQTDGYDLSISYGFELAQLGLPENAGSMALTFNGTKVNSFKFQATPTSINRECLGYYSIACGPFSGNPTPEYKWSARAVWSISDFDFGVQWRHIDEVIEEPGGTNFLPAFASIPDYNYFDLSAQWDATENLSVNLTVTNLFDEQPPVVGNDIGPTTTNSGNTFPQTYDAIGRYFTVGLTAKF